MMNQTSKPHVPDALVAQWQWIADTMAKVCSVPAALVTVSTDAEVRVLASSRGEGNPYSPGLAEGLESGAYCATVVSTRERLLVPNARETSIWADNPDVRRGMVAFLGYPLLWPDDEVFGTICIMDRKANPYSAEIDREVRHFRDLVQLSLAQLYENLRRKRTESDLEKTIEELTAINALAGEVRSTLEIERVFQLAAEQVLGVVRPDVVLEYLTVGELLTLRQCRAGDKSPEYDEVPQKSVGECLCGLAAETGNSVFSRDIDRDHRCTLQECKNAGIRSFAALPLKVGETILGVLGIGSMSERDFSERAVFLETIADQIAGALQSAMLHEELAKKAAELESRVSHRTEELSELNRRLERELVQRTATEQALRESEERFRQLTENIEEVFWLMEVGDSLRTLYVSPAYERIWARSAEQLYADASAWEDAIHKDDREKVGLAFAAFFQGAAGFDVEYRIVRPDGSVRWIWDRGFHIPQTEGAPLRVAGIALDITERKRNEQALIERENQLREANKLQEQLLDTAATGIFMTDSQGIVTALNDEFCAVTGYSREEVIGKDCHQFCDGVGDPCLLTQLSAGERVVRKQVAVTAKEGTKLTVLQNAAPLTDRGGEVVGAIESFVDVTELIEARKAAEEASKFKSEFVANMSHEIRTPLNAVLGLSDLALRSDLTPRLEDYFTKIRASSRSLLGIINDILDFSKIEAGRIEIESVPFNLEVLLTDLADMFAPVAGEKGIEFCLSIPLDVPLDLVGDPLRLGQVLTNLTGNAFKFTHSGEIVVSVARAGTTSDGVRLDFSVSDSGIGIPEEKLSKVFDSFSQADTSTTRRYGGSGLGLTISRQLVHMMGGSIRVESAEGKGSTFHFTMELGLQDDAPPRRLIVPHSIQGLKVLLVDDSETSRQIVGESLRAFSLSTTVSASGRDALALLVAAAETDPFKLVLIDWNMPDLDGLTTTLMIRRDPRLTPCRPHIIMLSEFSREEKLRKAMRAGADAFFVKPVSQSAMFDAIMDVFGQSNRKMVEDVEEIRRSRSRALDRLRGAKILVAEDNLINQQVAVEILKALGVRPTLAQDGKAAVEAVSRETFDAVLMDIQMPVMDGYEAARMIRADPKNRDLPIIAMTAHAMKGDREKSLAAGINDHITKPIDIDQLTSALISWVAPRYPEPDSEPEDADTTPSQQEPEIPTDLPGIHVAAAITRLGGNKRLLRRLLKDFVRAYSHAYTTLREALSAGDLNTAKRLVHTLKGVSGNISAERLFRVTGRLDSELKSGMSAVVEPLLEEFDKELSTVLRSAAGIEDETETSVSCDAISPDRSALTSGVIELAQLLGVQNMKAEDRFEGIRVALACSGLAAETEKLGERINELDYPGALGILSHIAETLGIPLEGVVP